MLPAISLSQGSQDRPLLGCAALGFNLYSSCISTTTDLEVRGNFGGNVFQREGVSICGEPENSQPGSAVRRAPGLNVALPWNLWEGSI